MEKENDRCILGHMEFEFWMAFHLGMFSMQDWRNINIGNIYLEFKCIEIIAEPGESRERMYRRTRRIKLHIKDGNTKKCRTLKLRHLEASMVESSRSVFSKLFKLHTLLSEHAAYMYKLVFFILKSHLVIFRMLVYLKTENVYNFPYPGIHNKVQVPLLS